MSRLSRLLPFLRARRQPLAEAYPQPLQPMSDADRAFWAALHAGRAKPEETRRG